MKEQHKKFWMVGIVLIVLAGILCGAVGYYNATKHHAPEQELEDMVFEKDAAAPVTSQPSVTAATEPPETIGEEITGNPNEMVEIPILPQ